MINSYVLPCLHKPGFKSQSLFAEAESTTKRDRRCENPTINTGSLFAS